MTTDPNILNIYNELTAKVLDEGLLHQAINNSPHSYISAVACGSLALAREGEKKELAKRLFVLADWFPKPSQVLFEIFINFKPELKKQISRSGAFHMSGVAALVSALIEKYKKKKPQLSLQLQSRCHITVGDKISEIFASLPLNETHAFIAADGQERHWVCYFVKKNTNGAIIFKYDSTGLGLDWPYDNLIKSFGSIKLYASPFIMQKDSVSCSLFCVAAALQFFKSPELWQGVIKESATVLSSPLPRLMKGAQFEEVRKLAEESLETVNSKNETMKSFYFRHVFHGKNNYLNKFTHLFLLSTLQKP